MKAALSRNGSGWPLVLLAVALIAAAPVGAEGSQEHHAPGAQIQTTPATHLHRLAQFASAASAGHDENGALHDDDADGSGLLAGLIEPMGALTLSLVAITVALGVFRRRWKPRLMLKMHKTCGVLALAAGAVHAALVMLLH